MKQPAVSPERKLTLKQRKWLDLYIKTGNATEAAMQVYDCKDRETAATIGWENIRKLDFSELMEESGLTDQLLNTKLAEGLDANKVISARIIQRGFSDAQEANEQTDDFIDVPDMPTRHKYLETALKLKRRLGPETVNQTNVQMNVSFSDE